MVKKTWFYLEPFVFVSQNNKDTLLFNTYSGEYLEFVDEPLIFSVIKELNTIKNKYCIEVDSEMFSSVSFKNQVALIKDGIFGNIIESENKPFIFYPKIRVQSDLLSRRKRNSKEIKRHLTDIFIILNEYNESDTPPPI